MLFNFTRFQIESKDLLILQPMQKTPVDACANGYIIIIAKRIRDRRDQTYYFFFSVTCMF